MPPPFIPIIIIITTTYISAHSFLLLLFLNPLPSFLGNGGENGGPPRLRACGDLGFGPVIGAGGLQQLFKLALEHDAVHKLR